MPEANGTVGAAAGAGRKQRYSALPMKPLAGKEEPGPWRACFRVLGVAVLVALFVFGVVCTVLMWSTDTFDNMILQNLVLRNNSQMFEWWQKPPVVPYIKVRFFNYTNIEAVTEGRERPRVEEVGPYTFTQRMEKRDVHFGVNDTVSYRDFTEFQFVPERSIGEDDDKLVLVNVPFLSAVSVLRDASFLNQIAMSMALKSVSPPPFQTFSAKEFLWGYKQTLTELAKVFSVVDIDPDSLKLGILEARAGIVRDVVTVETGARDIDCLGRIVSVGGRTRISAWGDSECSRIDGSDGSMFPPRLVQRRERLYIYTKDMCRRLPLDFHSTTYLHGVEAYIYSPPLNVFSTPEQNPDNECFCPNSTIEEPSCPYGGVFSVSPCNFGAPVLVSFPHFYGGDSELFEFVDGLQPNSSLHSLYLTIHPVLGVPLGGKTRFQLNVKVRKSPRISSIDFLQEGAILPVAWLEIGVDELPDELIDLLQKVSFTTNTLKPGLLYGGIAAIFISAFCLLQCIWHYVSKKNSKSHPIQDMLVLEPL